jgi:hypothetical protein
MAPHKFNFSGLSELVQNLVISKMEPPEAANLGRTSREMRAAVADPLEKMKRKRAEDAEAHAQNRAELLKKLPDILKRPFLDPEPQHVAIGKYTVSTTRPTGPSPFYFQLTVAAREMSVGFCIWDSDLRFWEPNRKAVVSQDCLMIGGKKKYSVPKPKKYDLIRKDVTDIRNCLKFPGTYHL